MQAVEIKLSQSYFSRWKRNLRCVLWLVQERGYLNNQQAILFILFQKENWSRFQTNRPSDKQEQNNSFFRASKRAFPEPRDNSVVRTVHQISLWDYKKLSVLKPPFLIHRTNLRCFWNGTHRAQKIMPRSQSPNIWFAVLRTTPMKWKPVEVEQLDFLFSANSKIKTNKQVACNMLWATSVWLYVCEL